MQVFDIRLVPGGVREINVRGSYIYFLNGSAGGADSTISVQAVTGSDVVLMKPGQAFRLPQGEAYTQWILKNHAGAGTIIGQVFVGEGDFFDNRISGSVEVIDGGKNRAAANQAMMLAQSGGGGAPGMLNTHQLWNPAASGKNLIVEQFFASCAVATLIYVGVNDVAMGVPSGSGFSKRAGGANSSGQPVLANIAGVPTNAKILMALQIPANLTQTVSLREPILLPPGFAFFVQCQTVETGITTTVEYFEESVTT